MAIKTVHISAKDGYLLTATLWKCANPSSIVTISAGTCIKRAFYQRFATWLHQHNIDVLTYDYRGVGDSRPANLKGFKGSIVDWAKKDIAGVIDWMVDNYPSQKRIMVGHSMGGQVVGLAPNINQLNLLIPVAASYGNWQNYATGHKRKVGINWATLFPILTWWYGYFPASKYNMGEDWPKGVTWDWWSWGLRRLPHSTILNNQEIPHFYQDTTIPISAYFTADDLMATAKTIPHFKQDFANAALTVRTLSPAELGIEKIGHMGMFSPKSLGFWELVLADIQSI